MESGCVDGRAVYTRLLVGRLETGAVLAFSNVDFCVVVVSVLTATRTFDFYYAFLMTMEVWEMRKFNVDLS